MAYRGRRTTRPRPALTKPVLLDSSRRRVVRAVRTSFGGRRWPSSNSNSLRASPCERASSQSWFGRSSTSTSTPGRSNERSPEKKLTDEQRQKQLAESSVVVAQYEALRGAVLGD